MSEVEKARDAIKARMETLLVYFSSKIVLHGLPWQLIVRGCIQSLRDSMSNEPQSTVVQSRPWNLNIGDLVHLEIKSGWKVRVLQACGLLLVAALPVLKKILAACKVRPGQLFIKSMVALYIFVDLACVVMAWLLCAAAPMAYHFGEATKDIAQFAGPLVTQTVQQIPSVTTEEVIKRAPAVFLGVAQNMLLRLVPKLEESLMPALRWDAPFFMKLARGSLVFVAASAVLAVVLCGAHWSAGVSAGVCGPLWLVSDDAKSRERQVDSTRGLHFMMVSRSLLLAGIVVLKWQVVDSVDASSFQMFFALICNRILDITEATYWWTCWVALCAVHCLFGLAAAFAAKVNREESSEGATCSEELTAEEYFQATYGTFDPAV